MSPTPTGSFDLPDVAIATTAAVPIETEANHIPVGTQVTLYLFSQDGEDQVIETSALTGNAATSTAAGSATFPPGFSMVFVHATW